MKFVYRCFNLIRRPDRRFVVSRTAPPELLSELQFINAIDGRNVSPHRTKRWCIGLTGYAVNLGKRLALREFLRSEADAVVLFEDDVSFSDNFWERFQWIIKSAPSDWGMIFLGGGHESAPTKTDRPGIVRCTRTHFNHAWVVRRHAAKSLLRELSRKPFEHIFSDQTIGRLQGTIPTYAPETWIARQRRSLSDNMGGMRGEALWNHRENYGASFHEDHLAVLQAASVSCQRILQWGGGSSTISLAQSLNAACAFDCVEHNQEVAGRLNMDRLALGLNNQLLIHHIPADYPWSGYDRPRQYAAYASGPKTGKESAYDLWIVRGKAHTECAFRAADLLRAGGLLALHENSKESQTVIRERLAELLGHYDLMFQSVHTSKPLLVFRRKEHV